MIGPYGLTFDGGNIVPPIVGDAGGCLSQDFSKGVAFFYGISIAMVTGVAENDNTSVAAGQIAMNLFMK